MSRVREAEELRATAAAQAHAAAESEALQRSQERAAADTKHARRLRSA